MALIDYIRRGEYVALADIEMEYEALGDDICALDATIAAQAEALADKQQDARMWSERAHDAECTNDALADEREELRGQLIVAQADCAAMREGLLGIRNHCGEAADGLREWHFVDAIREQAQAALSGTAGKALLDELGRLRAVAETAAKVAARGWGSVTAERRMPPEALEELHSFRAALAALDAGEGEEVSDAE